MVKLRIGVRLLITFIFSICFILCVGVFYLNIYLYILGMCSGMPEKRHWISESGDTDDCEPPCRCRKSNTDPLEEQPGSILND